MKESYNVPRWSIDNLYVAAAAINSAAVAAVLIFIVHDTATGIEFL